MNDELELRSLIIDIGKRMWARGYVAANDGNISVRLGDGHILTTPTGVSKGFMNPDMIVITDMDGNIIPGVSIWKPSSEIKMHLEIYRERPDVMAVVHAHPPYSTCFAVAGIPLDRCVLSETAVSIGAVPIVKFGLPSTSEIPDAIKGYIQKTDVLLLANHGALTVGTNLMNAYFKMESLEHTASIIWKAMQIGRINVLPEYERDRLSELRKKVNPAGRAIECSSEPF